MSINAWGSDDPAEVAKGGTGDATLTDHGVMLGSGTSPVTVTAAPTDGQLLIGNSGSDPSVAAPTGDANEISITTGSGTLAIGIADNPVIPGNEDMLIPLGTTAQEPAASNGMIRYDSDTDKLRGVENGTWQDIITSGGGAGSLKYITHATGSAVASLTLDNTVIADYENFMFVIDAHPATSGAALKIEVSNDNGSTWHTSGYVGRVGSFYAPTVIHSYAPTASFYLEPNQGQYSGASASLSPSGVGMFWINHPLNTSYFTTLSNSTYQIYTAGGSKEIALSGCYYSVKEANNAIKFAFSSGNISTISVYVWGTNDA